MSWRDNLFQGGKGSFRGVEFYVDSADSAFGRRSVTFEFPGRDQPMTQDLGRRARRFSLVAYVLGVDYMVERDKLRKAFEKPGPGPLTHPYWGRLTVAVDGEVSIRESTEEGGIARFTLRVVESSGELTPTARPDTAVAVISAADLAMEKIATAFAAATRITRVIAAVINEFASLISLAAGVLNKVNKSVHAIMNAVDSVGEAIDALGNAATSLALAPAALASQLQDVVSDVYGAINTVGDAWSAYFTTGETAGSTAGTPSTAPAASTPATGVTRAETLLASFREIAAFGSTISPVVETTEQREAQAANQTAFIEVVQITATVEACRAIVELPLVSYDQANEIRDELVEQLDTLAEATTSDEVYAALVELRATVVAHLAEVAATLPRVVTYEPVQALPALVIAQYLYGDSTRDTEIVERNNIRNPLFTSGELEVLSSE